MSKTIIVKRSNSLLSDIFNVYKPENTYDEIKSLISDTHIPVKDDDIIGIGNNMLYAEGDIVNFDDLKKGVFIIDTSNMSMIEKLTRNAITVPSQYDEKYKNIATNQCTWFSIFVANDRKHFVKLFNENKSEFFKKYSDTLLRASEQRNTHGKLVQGENIDEVLELTGEKKIVKQCAIGITDFIKTLPQYVIDMLIKPNIPFSNFDTLLQDISKLEYMQSIVINRQGQTFAVVKNNLNYLLFDSHTHKCGIITYKNLVKYVQHENAENNCILWTIFS